MKQVLTEEQRDGLIEIINIGVGRAAGYMNEMIASNVELSVPEVKLLSSDEVGANSPIEEVEEISCVYLGFSGQLVGRGGFALTSADSIKLAAALTHEAPSSPELLACLTETLSETGNILINGVLASISDILKLRAEFTVPGFVRGKAEDVMKVFNVSDNDVIIFIRARFSISDYDISGNILLIFQVESFDALVSGINQLYLEG